MRILLIQLRRLGDVLMTTPAIRAVRQHYPSAQITFLTEAPSDQLLEHNPHLNEVLVFPRKTSLLQKAKWLIRYRGHFDQTIDFFGNTTSAFITLMINSPRRVGFDFRGRKLAYTEAIPLPSQREPYAVLDKLLLLSEVGIQEASLELEFPVSKIEQQYAQDLLESFDVLPNDFLVTVSPVSRQEYKVWSTARFAEICDRLIQQYQAKILFVYGPGEQFFVDEVRAQMKEDALPDYPPPSLGQTRALFERAHLHLGNDNGPRHFAIAAGIPTVGIFGRPLAENWTPPGSTHHLAIEYDPGCKRNCHYPNCQLECLDGISTETVWKVVSPLAQTLTKTE